MSSFSERRRSRILWLQSIKTFQDTLAGCPLSLQFTHLGWPCSLSLRGQSLVKWRSRHLARRASCNDLPSDLIVDNAYIVWGVCVKDLCEGRVSKARRKNPRFSESSGSLE